MNVWDLPQFLEINRRELPTPLVAGRPMLSMNQIRRLLTQRGDNAVIGVNVPVYSTDLNLVAHGFADMWDGNLVRGPSSDEFGQFNGVEIEIDFLNWQRVGSDVGASHLAIKNS